MTGLQELDAKSREQRSELSAVFGVSGSAFAESLPRREVEGVDA